jgi:CheY-like chemotaxis protein
MSDETAYGAGGRFGRNPVAVIAVLVLVVYTLVCLVLATGSDLRDFDRTMLICFVVFFPILILFVFVWPVMRRTGRVSEAVDSTDDATFLAVMSLLLNAQTERNGDEQSVVQAEETAAAVFAACRRLDGNPGTRRRILWIDDKPDNNVLERQAFERLGIRVDSTPSTASGTQDWMQQEYGAIVVSDSERLTGRLDELLQPSSMVASGDRTTPVFVYTASDRDDQRLEAINRGAQDATGRPSALFDMVMRSLT